MTVRILTRQQMLDEIACLVHESGTTEDQLRAAGLRWELYSHQRGLLQQIDGLRWMLQHTEGGLVILREAGKGGDDE